MSHCLIGLGSNLGDRAHHLDEAIRQLRDCEGIVVVRHSAWHESRAIGGPPGQPEYLNGAAFLQTTRTPQALLAKLQEIEQSLGRRRDERWGARTLDLDLLLYDSLDLQSPELILPHPRMAWRRFVLRSAVEIAPSMIHPTTGWTIARLWQHLTTAANYVALAGTIAVGKTLLAEQLSQAIPARLVAEQVDRNHLASFYGNPASNAWAIELEFLRQRTQLLVADRWEWSTPGQFAISDFWFDQSRAFAGYWLTGEEITRYVPLWEQAQQQVVKPKLVVVLMAPVDQLQRRIRERGRPGEQGLSVEILQDIDRAILAQVRRPDQGPVLLVTNEDPQPATEEVLAAIRSME